MPKKPLSEKKIQGLPKRRRSRYLSWRRYEDRRHFLKLAAGMNSYLEGALQMKDPEKELALTVWKPVVERLRENLARSRVKALKSEQHPLDRRRDLQTQLDLLSARIDFDPIKLDLDDEYLKRMLSELDKKINRFPRTREGQELRESLESLKQPEEAKEIGKLTLKLTANKP